MLGGLVAGEGCFRRSERRERFRDGSPRIRFVFELSLAEPDLPLVEALQAMLGGAGTIRLREPRRPGWQREACLTVAAERLHLARTIPFAEQFLPPCHKRAQFERWRDELSAYRQRREQVAPAGRGRCSVEGCDDWIRGQGLCRRHYYQATGW